MIRERTGRVEAARYKDFESACYATTLDQSHAMNRFARSSVASLTEEPTSDDEDIWSSRDEVASPTSALANLSQLSLRSPTPAPPVETKPVPAKRSTSAAIWDYFASSASASTSSSAASQARRRGSSHDDSASSPSHGKRPSVALGIPSRPSLDPAASWVHVEPKPISPSMCTASLSKEDMLKAIRSDVEAIVTG